MTKEEAIKLLAANVAAVQALLKEAVLIADEAGITFKFYPEEGAQYGLKLGTDFTYNEADEEVLVPAWKPIDSEGWVPSRLEC